MEFVFPHNLGQEETFGPLLNSETQSFSVKDAKAEASDRSGYAIAIQPAQT